MEQSILLSTKKILGVPEDYNVFDLDILTHINTAFSTLTQLGVGPAYGFMIEDETAEWSDFLPDYPSDSQSPSGDDHRYNSVKSYVFLKVRQLFDPPATSYLISAVEKQLQELEWRLNAHREDLEWVDPDPNAIEVEDIHGGTVVQVTNRHRIWGQ
jgi:hypothetical protein